MEGKVTTLDRIEQHRRVDLLGRNPSVETSLPPDTWTLKRSYPGIGRTNLREWRIIETRRIETEVMNT